MPLVAEREETVTEAPIAHAIFTPLKAYPNPFKDRVTVNFTLPETQPAEVKVYDIQGREIITLFQGEAKANQKYEVEWQADAKPSGIYLLQLQTPTHRQHQKLLLSK